MVSEDYIVGLTDGEGCFYILVKPPLNKKGGARVELRFHIKMQEKDRKLLERVKNTLGCGAVYFQHEKRKNHVQCYRYTASSNHDIFAAIIPFFKRHPLQSSSKRKSFKIFCQIAEITKKGKHLKRKGREEIQRLKSTMNRRTIGLA